MRPWTFTHMTGLYERVATLLLLAVVLIHGVSANMLQVDEQNFLAFVSNVLPGYPSLFNSSVPTCQWTGLSCIGLGTHARIYAVTLSELGLNGSIPNNTLGALTALQILDLSNNSLTGEIPSDIFRLPNLIYLRLSNNKLTGRLHESVSIAVQLRSLYLSQNLLGGPLPSALGNLRSLQVLDLHANNFSGDIPALVNAKFLISLDLSSNQFTGIVPSATFYLQQMTYLNLSRNLLTGRLPSELSWLWLLRELDLSGNDFDGDIPDLSNLQQLRVLSLSSNRLNGSLPSALTRIPYLRALSVGNNKLTGSLPPLPWGISRGKIGIVDCENNFLNGSIPEGLLASPNLTIVRLANNYFTGSIPTNVTPKLQELDLGSNQFSGDIPATLANLNSLRKLDLSSNLLNGSVPWGLADLMSLQHLDLAQNQFVGGILPNFSQLVNLMYLNLSSSNIGGPIPDSVGELGSLAQLDLSHNHLNGSIPTALARATNLTSLDLSYNNLTGAIPLQLVSLTWLSNLNLSFNNLSGEVPHLNQWNTFGNSSFVGNPLLCGSVLNRICSSLLSPVPSPVPSINASESPVVAPSPSRHSSEILSDGAVVAIVLGGSLALCAFLCTIALFHKHRFKRLPSKESPNYLSGPVTFEADPHAWAIQISQPASIPVILFEKPLLNLTFADLLHATSKFQKDTQIADGGYGPIFKGLLPGGLQIVVKVLYDGGPANELEKAAQLEALGKIRHPNLVSLIGYCLVGGERLLVYEHMENGDLYQRLHEAAEEPHHPDQWTKETWEDAHEKFVVSEELSWPLRHRIAVGVARALAFLHHGCSPNVVHCDVTSSNILLDAQYEPHLADCGLASLVDSGHRRSQTPIMLCTVGYVPPEYGQTWKATARGDVYSFGVVLLELVTGKRPTGQYFHDSYGGNLVGWVRSLIQEKRGYRCLDPKLLSTGVESEMLETLRIGYLCTAEVSSKRPTMQQVLGLLKDIEVDITCL